MRALLAASLAFALLAAGCGSIGLPASGRDTPAPASPTSPAASSPVASGPSEPPPASGPPPTPPEAPAPGVFSEPVPPSAPRVSPPAPASPPAVVKPAPSSSAPGPVEPPPPPPPPVVAARVPNEDQIAEEVRASLAKTQKIVNTIDGRKLSRDQLEIFTSIQDFLTKAKEAYQAQDVSRAQVLAEKASKLAENLAGSLNR
jgi:hypothetical protein